MNLLSVTTHRNGFAPCEQQMERSDSGEVVEGACESSSSLTKSRGSLKTATVCISEIFPLLQLSTAKRQLNVTTFSIRRLKMPMKYLNGSGVGNVGHLTEMTLLLISSLIFSAD